MIDITFKLPADFGYGGIATFRRKIHDFRDDATWPPGRQTRRESPAGSRWQRSVGGLRVVLVLDCAANIDEVVGNYPKPDPALHADVAPISAAVKTMPPLGDADAALAAGAPFLAVAEPTFLLL